MAVFGLVPPTLPEQQAPAEPAYTVVTPQAPAQKKPGPTGLLALLLGQGYNPAPNNQPHTQAIAVAQPNPAAGQPAPKPMPTGVQSFGTNDTGRTTPIAANPTFANNNSLGNAKAPAWAYQGPTGSGGTSGGSSASPQTGLAGLMGGLGLGGANKGAPQEVPAYQAALRERPADIQQMVSMTRTPADQLPQNPAGSFLGGLFDK